MCPRAGPSVDCLYIVGHHCEERHMWDTICGTPLWGAPHVGHHLRDTIVRSATCGTPFVGHHCEERHMWDTICGTPAVDTICGTPFWTYPEVFAESRWVSLSWAELSWAWSVRAVCTGVGWYVCASYSCSQWRLVWPSPSAKSWCLSTRKCIPASHSSVSDNSIHMHVKIISRKVYAKILFEIKYAYLSPICSWDSW